MSKKDTKKIKFSRRNFLKTSGAAGVVLGSCGIGLYGFNSGKNPESYTGCELLEGVHQNFNRDRFSINYPPYEKIGETCRPDARTEVIFSRFPKFRHQWNEKEGLNSLDPVLKEYYTKHPENLQSDLYLKDKIFPKMMDASGKYRHKFALSKAWSDSMGAVWPEGINNPPEISDFPKKNRYGKPYAPYKMKSPEKTAKLIKKISHEFGSVLVGITKLNPDWVYKYPTPGRGFDSDKPLEIPKHWEYAIVVGTPMSWDPFLANPNYGTSFDAYSKSRIVAYRLAAFIRHLGYPARPHTPGFDYDLMVPPIAIDAGLGEQGRHSVLITPEFGSNFRPAIVTTNLPMKTDKPIEFGVKDFCKTCKICADNCPSGAISNSGMQDIRGYRRWQIDVSKCHNFWYSNLGNIGCRLCLAVCPYSRKSNWLHKTALNVTANDPTGLSHKFLIEMQKKFYPGPKVEDYYFPSMGGKNASYREPPWWLKSEDFIESVEVIKR